MNLKVLSIASIGLGTIGGMSVGGYYLFKPEPSTNNNQSAKLPKDQETNDLSTQKIQAAETTDNRPSNVGRASSGPDQGQSSTDASATTQSPESGRSEGGVQGPSR